MAEPLKELRERARKLCESLLWSHSPDGRRVSALHPEVNVMAERIVAFASLIQSEAHQEIESWKEKYTHVSEALDDIALMRRQRETNAAKQLTEARAQGMLDAAEIAESPELWKKLAKPDAGISNLTVAGRAIAEVIRERAAEAQKGLEGE